MTDIHTIKLPLEVNLYPIISISIVLIVIIAILTYLILSEKPTKNSNQQKTEEIKIDYKKLALEKIKKLESKIDKQNIRLSFHELCFYVKEYLKNTSNKNVVEMTAREIHSLYKSEEIDEIMKLCYKGEFMKREPKMELLTDTFDLSYKLISRL